MHTDRIPVDDRRAVINRLRRAEGQLRSLSRSLDEGGDCEQVLQQLIAARNAVSRAGAKFLAAGLLECVTSQQEGDLRPADFERLLLDLT